MLQTIKDDDDCNESENNFKNNKDEGSRTKLKGHLKVNSRSTKQIRGNGQLEEMPPKYTVTADHKREEVQDTMKNHNIKPQRLKPVTYFT